MSPFGLGPLHFNGRGEGVPVSLVSVRSQGPVDRGSGHKECVWYKVVGKGRGNCSPQINKCCREISTPTWVVLYKTFSLLPSHYALE